MHYSATQNQFYPDEYRDRYEASGTWPADAVEVPEDLYRACVSHRPADMEMVPGPDGLPILVKREAPPWSPDALLNGFRAAREVVLNRLAGIAFAALVSGDSATVNSCVSLRVQLLGVTEVPEIVAAADDGTLQPAICAAVASIIQSAGPGVSSVFNGIQWGQV